jgi:hypothetical protein
MKLFKIIFFTLIFSQTSWSQKDCEFATMLNDSLGSLRTTKDYLMYEKQFGSSETYIYFSASNADGTPFITLQLIEKNNGFISTTCLNSKSRIVIQLENGKIISLFSAVESVCGNLFKDPNGKNTRILTGNFLFPLESLEQLKESKISIIRLKSMGGSKDYLIKSEFVSELLGKSTQPAAFFQTFIPCIE